MTDPDSYLVRGAVPDDTYNLALGEPRFLHKHLLFPVEPEVLVQSDYPPHKGSGRLLEELGWLYPGKHVVVANGAKQALLAAFYAYKEMGRAGVKWSVYHEAPHWPSYPTLAELSGVVFQSTPRLLIGQYEAITVKTLINNPDGRIIEPNDIGNYDVLDCAYGHPVYGWNGLLPDHEVSVWSAAKLFGMSGDRIGWLVTGNKEIAELAASYIEKTTSGVNTRSQALTADVLQFVRENKELTDRWYRNARGDLLTNGTNMFDALYGYCYHLHRSNRGMFSWFQVGSDLRDSFDAILKEAKVMLVPGKACGATEDGWYRMSLGNTPEVTAAALQSLSEVLGR